MGNHNTIGVLLIDNATLLTKTIEHFLQIQPGIELIATTDTVDDIPVLIPDRQSVVILLGVRNGTWADVEALRQIAPHIPIILMGLLEETSIKALKLNNGADSYIDKSCLILDLVPELKRLIQATRMK
jgi:DNA-binding NarL/FixJ family response regulator